MPRSSLWVVSSSWLPARVKPTPPLGSNDQEPPKLAFPLALRFCQVPFAVFGVLFFLQRRAARGLS